jgi:hypothetical protein
MIKKRRTMIDITHTLGRSRCDVAELLVNHAFPELLVADPLAVSVHYGIPIEEPPPKKSYSAACIAATLIFAQVAVVVTAFAVATI